MVRVLALSGTLAPVERPLLERAWVRARIARLLEMRDAPEKFPGLERDMAEEMDVVPIESLLYRGRAALTRARELRETLRASLGGDNGGGVGVAALDQGALDELLDLLDLAAAE